MEKLNFFCKIGIFLKILKNIVKYPKFWNFFQILKNLKSLKNFDNFDNFFSKFWIDNQAGSIVANPVFWGPGLCCSWPAFPDRLQWALTLKPSDTYNSGPKNRSKPLDQPLRISKGWREEVWVRGGNHYGGEWSSRGVWDTFWGPLRLQGQLVLVDLENWFK